jgi:two-component sensor histidine kinase
LEKLGTPGMQLITTLVEQLDGELELSRKNGTKFIIRFPVIEKNKRKITRYRRQSQKISLVKP